MNKTLKELRELNEIITLEDIKEIDADILTDIEGHVYEKTDYTA